jgi:tetratricopeptide (TPR) repeat protein
VRVPALTTQLRVLESTDLIQRALSEPEIGYMFRHALVQEAVYASLLKRDREHWHRIVGETLERMHPERVNAFEWSAMLGHHFAQAGLHQKAWGYLAQAGHVARGMYANVEAIALYRAALREIEALSPGDEALRRVTLQLHEAVGDVLSLIGRAPDATGAYHAALACTRAPSSEAARLQRKLGNTWEARRELDRAFQAYDRAEQALGPQQAHASWWQGWIEIQLDRMFVHYWRAEWREIAALADVVRPIIERHGTPLLRARFYDRWAGISIRRDRYVIANETLELTQAGLFASEASGDTREITNARFNMGFAHLWRDELDEAQRHLQASLQLARQTGDATYQTWCVTYLSVLSRKRGETANTRRLALEVLDIASRADLTPWVAAAHANLGWVNWREGHLAEAQRLCRQALQSMQALPLVVPFYWLALWPLAAIMFAQDDMDAALEHARLLLLPTQQPLPEAIAAHLGQALRPAASPQAARTYLQRAIELARQAGYL